MKHLKFCLFWCFSMSFIAAEAQQNHFIYIQTENKQPFYVKLDNKLLSSTSSGYVVLSKLKSGTYNLAIGFPKSEWPEQNIPCTITNKDLGFVLKNFGEKGWGLFNLQTLDVVLADEKKKTNVVAVETKTDEFSTLLSSVVNDPTIKQVEKINEPEKSVSPASTAPENLQVPAVEPGNVATAAVAGAVVTQEPAQMLVKRTLLNKTDTGTEMVFLDLTNGSVDTIAVFIPVENQKGTESVSQSNMVDSGTQNNTAANETAVVALSIPEPKKSKDENSPTIEYNPKKQETTGADIKEGQKDSRFIDMNMADTVVVKSPNKTEKPEEAGQVTKKDNQPEIIVSNPAMINSDCKAVASDADFMKLRKKMVGEESDDDMVTVAKKAFKSKCYSVEQIRNLSVLFLKDEGKYAFFDMAYPHVSDSHNYKDLEGQLTDPYFVNRFKVMIRQ